MNELVIFSGPGCGPCRRQHVEVEEFQDNYPSVPVRFLEVDDDRALAQAQALGIRSVPAQVMFSDGVPVKTHVGVLTAQQLPQWLGVGAA